MFFSNGATDDFRFNENVETSTVVNVSLRKAVINASVSLGFIDNDGDKVYDYWEHNHGMSTTNGADAFLDPDNDGLLNLHEYWLDSHPLVHDLTNSVIQLFTQSVDSRLMVNATSNEVAVVLPKFENYTTNNFSLNTNFWLRDVDTSSVSMWTDQVPANSNEWSETMPSQRSGVAISKRHILQANHWAVEANNHVVFYGTDGNVYTNKVIDARYIKNDVRVGLLEDELPDAVFITQIMPTNFFNYIGSANRMPLVFLEQHEEARIVEIEQLDFTDEVFDYHGSYWVPQTATREIRQLYYKFPIWGDSGSPFFFLAGDTLVLAGAAWNIYDSPFVGFYTHQIQSKMNELCPGYQLQVFDLSQFLEVKTERVKK